MIEGYIADAINFIIILALEIIFQYFISIFFILYIKIHKY